MSRQGDGDTVVRRGRLFLDARLEPDPQLLSVSSSGCGLTWTTLCPQHRVLAQGAQKGPNTSREVTFLEQKQPGDCAVSQGNSQPPSPRCRKGTRASVHSILCLIAAIWFPRAKSRKKANGSKVTRVLHGSTWKRGGKSGSLQAASEQTKLSS